ncbi:MAG: hypothetical protein HKM98_04970 [Gammaproteobacteria bacterium]|nr:hypothetical protein [Gammaproteobacteria bacterium]
MNLSEMWWMVLGNRWSMFQKPEEIEAHLSRANIEIADSTGVAVNPFARRLRKTRMLAVNYMLFCVRR